MEDNSQEKNPLLELVKDKITELGWKQVDLIRHTGVSGSIISRFLKGTKGIGTKNIFLILDALGLLSRKGIFISNPDYAFSAKARRYDFLKKIVFEINEVVEREVSGRVVMKYLVNYLKGHLELEGVVDIDKYNGGIADLALILREIIEKEKPPPGIDERRKCMGAIKSFLKK